MREQATTPRSCAYPALTPPVAVPLTLLPLRPCPYHSDRSEQIRAFAVRNLPGHIYHAFMDAGFRRCGTMIYQPVCPGCRACAQLRIPVDSFHPDKSQRRCWRGNRDLQVTVGAPQFTDEKYDLYERYQMQWHHKPKPDSMQELRGFLYESPVQTFEFCYRDGAGRLLGVGICDVCQLSLSSVYFFHDPSEARRGIGTYGVLKEIQWAAQHGIAYYYLGFWVAGCGSMDYKRRFRPFELLGPDGAWRAGACDEQ